MKHLLLIIIILSSLTTLAHDETKPTDKFTISGLVKYKRTFTTADLLKMPQQPVGDIIIKNHRGEDKGKATDMKGILLKTLLDSAAISMEKPKDYSSIYIVLTASDGYKNVYSWNELFNNELGNHVFIITEKDGKTLRDMDSRIIVISTGDINTGRRHFKGLQAIEVKKAD